MTIRFAELRNTACGPQVAALELTYSANALSFAVACPFLDLQNDRDLDSSDVDAGIQPCSVLGVWRKRPIRSTGSFLSAGPDTSACLSKWTQPRLRISRPTWSRWYFTPKWRLMTSAIRAVVHGSVLYPFVRAPFRNSLSNCLRWPVLSFRGRPGEERTRNACSPPRFQACCQRNTELAAQLMTPATSRRERPSLRSLSACRRRSSSNSADPFTRAIEVLQTNPLSMALMRCCNVYADTNTMPLKPCLQSEHRSNVNFFSSIRSGKRSSMKIGGSIFNPDWLRCSAPIIERS